LSAPEIKSEIAHTTSNSNIEQGNQTKRIVIYDDNKISNQQDDQSMIDDE
jgi:hypothetical protein